MILLHAGRGAAEIEDRWSREFVALGERLPGLRRVAVSRILGGPGGTSPLQLVHELYFDDWPALQRALDSEAGQVAGRALQAIAGRALEICYAEHHEEARG
jgi:uncharacterized protein (TIGR02118 family)